MVVISFVGTSQADLRRQVQSFLDDAREGDGRVPATKLPDATLVPDDSETSGSSYAFVAAVLSRIPKGRVARAVLRDIGEATLRGERSAYLPLRAKYAADDGQKYAGYTQSIRKVSERVGGPEANILEWDEDSSTWSMSEANARALLDLLAQEDA